MLEELVHCRTLNSGFISRCNAKDLGVPLKLKIKRIGRGDSFNVDRVELSKGQHIQSCEQENNIAIKC